METNIDLERALELIKTIEYKREVIALPLEKALGYVLSKDIYAPLDQPPFSKSAMDGYAFNLDDDLFASKEEPQRFDVVGCIYAGEYFDNRVEKNQAVRIMTGARVPESCNSVIRYEDTNNDFTFLEVYQPIKKGSNICFQGEDIKSGELLLKEGEKLDYVRLAILSSMGINEVHVYQKLKIALCVTGSEVTLPNMPRGLGQIYDSNMMLLSSRLETLGYSVSYKTILQDDASMCATQLVRIADSHDFIITTGGVSVGDKDIMHDTLDMMNAKKIFWRVNLKPGTPVLFSIFKNVPILSLSGNPFASSVTFELFARSVIAHMLHDSTISPKCTKRILVSNFPKASKRRRFIRAKCKETSVSIPQGMHSSNELRSMIDCNCIIDVPAGNTGLKVGDEVTVWLI